MTMETEPLVQVKAPTSQLQKYYASFESRIGYRLFLGGTRHFGYYDPGVKWPFPVDRALRRMEDHVFKRLALSKGAKVLDAGCGVGHVAMQMARNGLRVQGIDIVKNHVQWAQDNFHEKGFDGVLNACLMDYHHLEFEDASFEGVYTMETLVHAHDPEQALGEFFRVLKPGGSIALFEYEHVDFVESEKLPKDTRNLMHQILEINKRSSMPGNDAFTEGVLENMLIKQGFHDIKFEDLSENVAPMVRWFFLVAYIPWLIICFLGLQAHFVNTQAGAIGYPAMKKRLQRYSAVTAKKPLTSVREDRGHRQRTHR